MRRMSVAVGLDASVALGQRRLFALAPADASKRRRIPAGERNYAAERNYVCDVGVRCSAPRLAI